MLFYLRYLNHEVEKLHELISAFFTEVENKQPIQFDISLFPAWYSQTPNRLEKLEKSLTEFILFNQEKKQQIISSFRKGNQLQSFFSDKSAQFQNIPISLDFKFTKEDGSPDLSIVDYLNDLFVTTLYTSQLSKSDSTFTKKIKSNLGNHFSLLADNHAANDEDFTKCPFCGIEPIKMLQSESRPDYDHLLPKGDSLYVFSAINLRNLAPIGDHCNEKKLTKNLLFEDEQRLNRSLAFYPYSEGKNPFELYHFELNCIEYPSIKNKWKGRWCVDIVPNLNADLETEEKIKTWDRVYNIKQRYEEYLERSVKSVFEKTLKVIDSSVADLLVEINNKLEYKLKNDYLYDYIFISTEEGLIPKRIFIQWLLQHQNFILEYVDTKAKFQKAKVNLDDELFE